MTYAAYKCDLRRMQPSVWETAIVSQKKESTLNQWNESFLKKNPKSFHVDVKMKH